HPRDTERPPLHEGAGGVVCRHPWTRGGRGSGRAVAEAGHPLGVLRFPVLADEVVRWTGARVGHALGREPVAEGVPVGRVLAATGDIVPPGVVLLADVRVLLGHVREGAHALPATAALHGLLRAHLLAAGASASG